MTDALERIRGSCSAASLELAEPMTGTATQATAWLLVEQPGPWGRKALTESRLDAEVAQALNDRAAEHDVRVQLIRSPDSDARPGTCFLAYTGGEEAWIDRMTIADPASLLEIDLAALGLGGRVSGGQPWAAPLYLVCTNARRDACCALFGRAVFNALAGTRPGHVWETSHVGGHRFAANMIAFPDGLVFGRLDPRSAREVTSSYERGEIALDHLRGRACLPGAAQAAEAFVRQAEGLTGVAEVAIQSFKPAGESLTAATARTRAGETFTVTVRQGRSSPPRLESCSAAELVEPERYELVGILRQS